MTASARMRTTAHYRMLEPEPGEYMAIGVLHDEEITQQSDIIEAVFGG